MKRLFSKLVPEVPILVAAALLLTMPSLRGTATGLATVFPFTVAAAALLLGWRFNPSRLVFAIAPLALSADLLLKGVAAPRQRFYFHAMTCLPPIQPSCSRWCRGRGGDGARSSGWRPLSCLSRSGLARRPTWGLTGRG